jgi:hypothetical protein
VQDEGILLVTVRDTDVAEWIQDARYREIMTSMINIADIGGPQEFILGGAVVQLQDFERFIPRGMAVWFRRRILEKRTRTNSPQSEEVEGDAGSGGSEGSEGASQGSEGNLSSAALGPGDVVGRLTRAMQILQREEDEIDVPEVPTPGPRIRGPNMW